MAKKKKKMNFAKKKDDEKNDFAEKIKKIVGGLYFMSETEAEIQNFTGEKAEQVSKEEILSQTKNASDAPVEEKDFAELFERLTKIQDWFEDEEKQAAAKFSELGDLLRKNLKNLKVFKIGEIELDVYIVGLDAEGRLAGIKTKAVET
jgi:hypothetical protein